LSREHIYKEYESAESENIKADSFGKLIDIGFFDGDQNLLFKLESEKDLIDLTKLDDFHLATYYYDLSNLYSSIRRLSNPDPRENWTLDDEFLKQEIYNLRKSISLSGFHKIVKERRCQIYTNLGNSLSFVGRSIQAQAEWLNSLNIIPNFPMTLGNMSNGLVTYSLILLEEKDKYIAINFAYKYIKKALELRDFLEQGAINYFDSIKVYLDENFHPDLLKKEIVFDKRKIKFNLTKKSKYRAWINSNKLLLNPINDLTAKGNLKFDDLVLPAILMPKESNPIYHILFNQIKQEYCSARYNLFLYGLQRKNHYSDKQVIMANYNNLFQYSYRTEVLKNAFKTFYSIFDKIGYFLNDYLGINNEPHKVSFRNIWYTNYQKGEINPIFNSKVNWSMRALFWVSKDLFDDDFKDTIEPESKYINQLRNYIEHKALIITKIPFDEMVEKNSFNYAIGEENFEKKTLKIAKLVREAIMYLCFAVEQIEREFNPDNLPFGRSDYTEISEK